MIYDSRYAPYMMRTPKPHASAEAFMHADENGNFCPDAPYTRGEAVQLYASLITYLEDFKDTYTSDYTDITPCGQHLHCRRLLGKTGLY